MHGGVRSLVRGIVPRSMAKRIVNNYGPANPLFAHDFVPFGGAGTPME
jgi:hypothetical protein